MTTDYTYDNLDGNRASIKATVYGFDKNGNFYADYWDGTAEEFNNAINNFETDFSKGRHQLFKIDATGNMSACVLDENGNRTKLVIDTVNNKYISTGKKHSPSGVIFALAAYIITKIKEARLTVGDQGFDVARIIYEHYQQTVDGINNSNVDKIANYLRCLDNDLYILCRYENKVKNTFDSLPFMPQQIDREEYMLFTDTEFDMDTIYGHSAILSGSMTLAQEGGYINDDDVPNKKSIIDIIKDELNWKNQYVLDSERVLSEEEKAMIPKLDDMIPSREVLTKLELIKASDNLRNILWTGEAGSGKSTAAQMVAQLANLPYVFLTFNPDTILSDLYVNILPATDGAREELDMLTASLPSATDIALNTADSYYQITGLVKPDASEEDCAKAIQDRYYNLMNKSNGFIKVESPLVQAFRYGWVLEMQEPNVASKPGVLSGINAAMDSISTIQLPDGEVIKRHKDCVIILTANVDYEGTRRLNQAVKSRCALKGRFTLPDDAALVEMIKVNSMYDDESTIHQMIQAMRGIRKVLNETGTTDGTCGVREVIAWATATRILKDPYRAAMHTIIPSTTDDDEVLTEVISAFENFFMKKSGHP